MEEKSSKFNFHSHCNFCDGIASMEEFVQDAIGRGFDCYGISSHAPIDFQTRWSKNQQHIDVYLQDFFRLKEKYQTKIELYLGLEIDYVVDGKDIYFQRYKSLPLDYRIGSLHYMDLLNGKHWNVGASFEIYNSALNELYGGSLKKMIERYFELTVEMIENCQFDIVGHLDKITDNAECFFSEEMDNLMPWYLSMFDEVLQVVKRKGVILEVNTKKFLTKKRTFVHFRHLKRMKDLGIPVMVNSDCHNPMLMEEGLIEAYFALKENGYRTVRVLRDGKWSDVEF